MHARSVFVRRLIWAALTVPAGCANTPAALNDLSNGFDRLHQRHAEAVRPVLTPSDPSRASVARGQENHSQTEKVVSASATTESPTLPNSGERSVVVVDDPAPCQPLLLPDAIATAFRQQPRLRVFLESVQQARGTQTVAAAPFYPAAVAGYSVGGLHLDVGGEGIPVGPGTNFNFVPFNGSVPVGLGINTGYEIAELKLAWLITDFGKRLGRYRQAELGVDIAGLQTDRAYQTVATEVAVAYYQLLRAKALRRIAEEAVRRADDDLDVSRKLAKGGVIEREKVLRAEVQAAQTKRALDQTDAAVGVAVASLNLAMGVSTCRATDVVPTEQIPTFGMSLCDCLQESVNRRQEFQVASRTVQVAQEGRRVARAEFLPRIVAEGALLDFQQNDPRGRADLALGFIKLEWGLFEGGKRVGELRVADSKIRSAVAQAEVIADTIAFQVNEAYRLLVAARSGIDRARPAVEQSQENYRLVQARAKVGDATPSDVIDAETSLTRAQQDYANSIYDYLISLIRLDYAMGQAPTPSSPPGPGGTGASPP